MSFTTMDRVAPGKDKHCLPLSKFKRLGWVSFIALKGTPAIACVARSSRKQVRFVQVVGTRYHFAVNRVAITLRARLFICDYFAVL